MGICWDIAEYLIVRLEADVNGRRLKEKKLHVCKKDKKLD